MGKGEASYLGPKFEATKLEGLYQVLDGVAWMDEPSTKDLAQFSGLDPRTVGKLVKNAQGIGLLDRAGSGIVLLRPYPFKGDEDEKREVVREALLRMPLMTSMRQFLSLGEVESDALRKAATVSKVSNYDEKHLAPLMTWARELEVVNPSAHPEDVIELAETKKEKRHDESKSTLVAFISHSSKDKPFARQLATDLKANKIDVWIDEQHIKVGESISGQISQGLANSDYFLFVVSENSVESEWVQKELNNALMKEVSEKKVHVLPLLLDDAKIPAIIADKSYADFRGSYKDGFRRLIAAMEPRT